MKVCEIKALIIVEDLVEDSEIEELCKYLEEDATNSFRISNFEIRYSLARTIDYPDIPLNDKEDSYDEIYDKWADKSREVIEKIKLEIEEKRIPSVNDTGGILTERHIIKILETTIGKLLKEDEEVTIDVGEDRFSVKKESDDLTINYCDPDNL